MVHRPHNSNCSASIHITLMGVVVYSLGCHDPNLTVHLAPKVPLMYRQEEAVDVKVQDDGLRIGHRLLRPFWAFGGLGFRV